MNSLAIFLVAFACIFGGTLHWLRPLKDKELAHAVEEALRFIDSMEQYG